MLWVLLLAAAVAAWFATDDELILTLAIQTFIMAALALSWNILGGFAGQISLGQAAFFGLGALITRELWLGGSGLLVAVLVALGVTALAAAVVGVPLLRFRDIYFAVGTLALNVGVWITAGNLWPGISSLPAESLREYEFTGPYFMALGVLVVAVAVSVWLRASKLGLGMMAVRDDEEAASATGVNALAHKLSAFVLSAVLAALAGAAFGFASVSYYPQFPFSVIWTFDAITVTFIGGLGTIAGPIIGSVFFVVGRDTLASALADLQVIVFGVLFILVVLLMPGGFIEFGERVFKAVFRRNAPSPPEKETREREPGTTRGKEAR